MGLEIERKFLVRHSGILGYANDKHQIRQGYLNLNIYRTVRVRTFDNTAWLTVKGVNHGAVRKEFEYQIPIEDGLELLEMCDGGFIDKTRYIIPSHDYTVEVDVFEGNNLGLIVAEIEFEEGDPQATMTENELRPHLPQWLDKEVTDDDRYFNSALLTTPVNTWSK